MKTMARCRRRSGGFMAALLVASLAGCASPNPDFYTLQPVAGSVVTTSPQIVELRRPGLAGYLDRADIVLKADAYQLHVNSQMRWAEPIGDMIGRVLVQDIGQRLPGSTVFGQSGAITADPTLRVEVDVQRFDQGGDGSVTLSAEVAVELGMTHKPLRSRTVVLQAPVAGPSAANLAAAMSALLGQLADGIAKDVAGANSGV